MKQNTWLLRRQLWPRYFCANCDFSTTQNRHLSFFLLVPYFFFFSSFFFFFLFSPWHLSLLPFQLHDQSLSATPFFRPTVFFHVQLSNTLPYPADAQAVAIFPFLRAWQQSSPSTKLFFLSTIVCCSHQGVHTRLIFSYFTTV